MAQKQEIDIGLSIYNKENKDLTYIIVDKKEMNGILHYLIESRARASTGSIYLSEYAIKERFNILKESDLNVETKFQKNYFLLSFYTLQVCKIFERT